MRGHARGQRPDGYHPTLVVLRGAGDDRDIPVDRGPQGASEEIKQREKDTECGCYQTTVTRANHRNECVADEVEQAETTWSLTVLMFVGAA